MAPGIPKHYFIGKDMSFEDSPFFFQLLNIPVPSAYLNLGRLDRSIRPIFDTTRMKLLQKLQTPKDRYQLAKELGLEWRSVDWEIAVLRKYGLVQDQGSYGKIVMYQLTNRGMELLKLLRETEANAP